MASRPKIGNGEGGLCRLVTAHVVVTGFSSEPFLRFGAVSLILKTALQKCLPPSTPPGSRPFVSLRSVRCCESRLPQGGRQLRQMAENRDKWPAVRVGSFLVHPADIHAVAPQTPPFRFETSDLLFRNSHCGSVCPGYYSSE